MDLVTASLNMQVIALGVFFGMLAAWTVRWLWRVCMCGVKLGARAAYRFVKAKRAEYNASRLGNSGDVKTEVVLSSTRTGKQH